MAWNNYYRRGRGAEGKYHNHKIEREGEKFDSTKEYRRWCELKQKEQDGEIKDLQRQVRIELIPAIYAPDIIGKRGGRKKGALLERKATYVADFVYTENGEKVVEDVKGLRTKDYILKRKILLWRYGIQIRET